LALAGVVAGGLFISAAISANAPSSERAGGAATKSDSWGCCPLTQAAVNLVVGTDGSPDAGPSCCPASGKPKATLAGNSTKSADSKGSCCDAPKPVAKSGCCPSKPAGTVADSDCMPSKCPAKASDAKVTTASFEIDGEKPACCSGDKCPADSKGTKATTVSTKGDGEKLACCSGDKCPADSKGTEATTVSTKGDGEKPACCSGDKCPADKPNVAEPKQAEGEPLAATE
jgi:hypothetical protein